MAKKKTIWKNRQGNICFRLEHHNRWWLIPCILIIMLIITCAVEYFFLGTYCIVIPSFFISLLVTYYSSLYSERKADGAILALLRKQLTSLVKKELAKMEDVHEVKRKIFYKYKSTYGVVEARSVLVLLSNKTVLEYQLYWNGGDEPYNELVTEARICTDSERIEFIHPRTMKDIIDGVRISDDNKLRIVLFGLLSASLIILIGLGWLVYVFGQKALLYFLIYIGTFTVLHIIQDFVKIRVFAKFVDLVMCPFIVVGILIKLAQPIITILAAFVGIPFIIGAITALVLVGIVKYGVLLERDTMAFISLTLTAILCVHSRSCTSWLIKHSPIKDKGNHRYEKFSEELALYVTDPKNYNLLFSLLYVVFLSCSAFCNIEYNSDLINKDADLVVMKSFLVYIAFNTMMQRSRETDINIKDLLRKILGQFEPDDK